MYWTSPLVGKAVALELVPTRPLKRISRRVRRRCQGQPANDIVWAEELVHANLLSRYQARVLLAEHCLITTPESRAGDHCSSPLRVCSYVIHDRIRQTDLGVTYRGKRPSDRFVSAIKRIDRQWLTHEHVREQVRSAIEQWSKLNDRHVVPMTCVADESGDLAVVSPWVAGRPLSDVLRLGRPQPPELALAVVQTIITVLSRADARGLVTGDLRPSNILLDSRQRPRLLDCGLRHAIPGAGLLQNRNLPPDRYDYVAPEVAMGDHPPDAVSDIYSIGCLLYHLLTGRLPYPGGDAERKCRLHRTGRLTPPREFGIDAGSNLLRILSATLRADRGERVGSYSELLNLLPAGSIERVGSRCVRPIRVGAGHCTRWTRLPGNRHGSWRRWMAGGFIAAAVAVAAWNGSARLLPLLQLRPIRQSSDRLTGEGHGRGGSDPAAVSTVTTLWNASEDLQAAFARASAHDTITLQSPGPFLLDAIDLNKPMTIRGADNVRPLFVGGPGTSLRITAANVRLENIHFVRVSEPVGRPAPNATGALIEATADRLNLIRCSFQDVSGEPTAGIHWRPGEKSGEPAGLTVRQSLFRNLIAAIDTFAHNASGIDIAQSMHLGYGPLVRSTSGRASIFDALDITLAHVSVIGAGTCEHHFPHPLDDAAPLRVTAKNCLLIPHDRDQPILTVEYAVQPSTLMPKVSWSGSGTFCPADATMLEVRRATDAAVWRASDVAAWQKYWGTHATGMVGARIHFAGSPAGIPADIPKPAGAQSPVGTDSSQITYPPAITLEQLPVLLKRLATH